MGPSEALSTNPPIPGILATPVRKVMSAFSYYHSTGEEIPPSQTFVDDMTPTKQIKILHASLGPWDLIIHFVPRLGYSSYD